MWCSRRVAFFLSVFAVCCVVSLAFPVREEALKWQFSHSQVIQEATKSLSRDFNFASSSRCTFCKSLVLLLQYLFQTTTSEDEVVKLLTELCPKLKLHNIDERVCNGVIPLFRSEVLTVFDQLALSPDEFCGTILGESCAHVVDPYHDWNVTFPKTPKPPVQPIPAPKAGSPVSKVLHISDIHLDKQYHPGTNPECGEPLCCRKYNGPPAPGKPGAGKWGSYPCDIPPTTLEAMLQHLKDNHQDVDYILWTGDVPAHNIWNQSREDQISALDNAAKLLLKYFPKTRIVPALGNHESSPVNSFPPPFVTGKDSNQWLLDALADVWQTWLPSETGNTIRKGGYYTFLINKGFRIISINMNYCNNMNWWLLLNNADPADMLEWLIAQLQYAEDNNEKVHIVGHIPPGSNDCLKHWSWNYYKIVDRYQSTIRAQFFGHTHKDHFELFYDEKTMKMPTSIAYIGPSVTTYQDLNPGYRIYDIDGDYQNSSRVVLDHHTYILDLEESNKGDLVFKYEYSAKSTYQMPSLLPKDWNDLTVRMEKNQTLFDTFYKLYSKSHQQGTCDESCKEYMICSLRSGRSHDKCPSVHLTEEQRMVFDQQSKLC